MQRKVEASSFALYFSLFYLFLNKRCHSTVLSTALYVMIMPEDSIRGVNEMNRREAREKALQTLFQLDHSNEITIEEAITFIVGDREQSDSFYEQLVFGTMEARDEIDEKLQSKLENWSLHRLPKVERTVLRMALYELQFSEETPDRVVVNEAIELCKTFNEDKSGRFVNGVLSKFITKQ